LRYGGWDGLQISQMSTIKVLVHKSFEFGGFCTWPSWYVWDGLTKWLWWSSKGA